jgi:hypothetical protein
MSYITNPELTDEQREAAIEDSIDRTTFPVNLQPSKKERKHRRIANDAQVIKSELPMVVKGFGA